MIERISEIDPASLERFGDIIDVRSPGEFREDRIPGAINLPVLDDAERAEVGTIYTKVSRFEARRMGAAYVARNVAQHLGEALAQKPAQYRPLLYCWRGGMRSGAMATILSQIGWRVGVLDGGYKTWRRKVVQELHDSDAPLKVVLLDGQTGTAKSRIVARLAELGAQAIDLEALANHRGSVFGSMQGEQPAQRLFESELWRAIERLDPARPIIVEAESSRVGRCGLPRRIWRAMLAAPRIVVRADAKARARYLVTAYQDIVRDREGLVAAIDRLKPFHGKERIERWLEMAGRREFEALAAELMQEHYDPLYDRSRKRRSDEPLAELRLQNLNDDGITDAARKIAALAERAANSAA